MNGKFESDSKRINELKDVVRKLDDRLTSHRNEVGRVFVDGTIPDAFRHDIVGDPLTITKHTTPTQIEVHEKRRAEARVRLGCLMARSFVADLKSRSKLFDVPITITGKAIATLEPELQAVWGKVYQKLDLAKLTKAPVYRAIDARTDTTMSVPYAADVMYPKSCGLRSPGLRKWI